MSIRSVDLQGDIYLILKKFVAYVNRAAELSTITTALGTDTTTHDKTIDAPPVALRIDHEVKTPFTNAINLLVNKGKGGNLTAAQISAAITAAAALP